MRLPNHGLQVAASRECCGREHLVLEVLEADVVVFMSVHAATVASRTMLFMTQVCTADNGDTLIRIKAVPGASRDAVVSLLGDRLKIRITAPPEGGKANKAICRILSKVLVCPVTIEAGHGSQLKTARAHGSSPARVAKTLGLPG